MNRAQLTEVAKSGDDPSINANQLSVFRYAGAGRGDRHFGTDSSIPKPVLVETVRILFVSSTLSLAEWAVL